MTAEERTNFPPSGLQMNCKYRICRGAIFYGPGVHELLLLTDKLHSLADACRSMGMSYTKGRRILRRMEEQLGCPVLITQQGGKTGGYSQLTDEARIMVHRYDAFIQDADQVLQPLFEKHFSGTAE